MTSLRTFLQTRIARRVFGLFLLCAVVPTATLAASGYWLIAREYRSQLSSSLAQASRISGALLLSRLQAADAELAQVEQAIGAGFSAPLLATRLRGTTLLYPSRRQVRLWGDPSIQLPPIPARARKHLEHGNTALVIGSAGGSPSVFLVRAAPSVKSGALLWGELSPARLWGMDDTESLVPGGIEVCVFSRPTPLPLYCSRGVSAVQSSRDQWLDGERSAIMQGGQQQYLAEASSVFLGFTYASPSWTIVLEQPLLSMTAKHDFQRTLLLTCLLGLSLVVLASNVLLRQSLDPVARLQEGTRRVAAGDLGAVVEVTTGDELQELATSFNTMATSLRRQFELLQALQQVDQEALGGRSAEAIIAVATERIRELFGRQIQVSIIIARRVGEIAFLTRWHYPAHGKLDRSEARMAGSRLEEWQHRPEAIYLHDGAVPANIQETFGAAPPGSLVLPLLDQGICFGGIVLQDGKDLVKASGSGEIERMRQLADQIALGLSHQLSIERLNEMTWGTLEALARSIDACSPWTAGHSGRVTRLAVALGHRMALRKEEIERLHRGGLLHDVGKIGIPSAVLDKPAALTDEEMALVQQHPVLGARILEPIHTFADVIEIVRHHHERFDGNGYPDRLVGDRIPLLARIAAVADVYDALVSKRPYRDGWSADQAKQYIVSNAGTQFDPAVVAAFLELAGSHDWLDITRGAFASVRARLFDRASTDPEPLS